MMCIWILCIYLYIHICKRYETESLLHLDTLLQDDDRIWLRQAAAARIQACYQGRMVREATRWPRWMIYRGMDWFVGDNLNRKPWIFPWRSWGFPVIVPLNQCIGNGTISVNFHCQLRLRLRGKGCDLVHHLENFGKIGTVWTCF